MMMSIPARLRETDRAALEAHFLALDGEDRRLRFGASISDEGVRLYVARIDFGRDGLFAVHDEELKVLAQCTSRWARVGLKWPVGPSGPSRARPGQRALHARGHAPAQPRRAKVFATASPRTRR